MSDLESLKELRRVAQLRVANASRGQRGKRLDEYRRIDEAVKRGRRRRMRRAIERARRKVRRLEARVRCWTVDRGKRDQKLINPVTDFPESALPRALRRARAALAKRIAELPRQLAAAAEREGHRRRKAAA